MRGTRLGLVVALSLWTLMGTGCGGQGGPAVDLATLPSPRVTLEAVGKRLGQKLSPADLTRIAARSSRVVAALTPDERVALGYGSVRFRVDRPVVVTIAVLATDPPPFWLADQRFEPTAEVVHDADGGRFNLYTKQYPAGWIGLGINALDRSAEGHYAVFVRSLDQNGELPQIGSVELDPVVAVRAGRDVSPYADVDRPIVDLPADVCSGFVVLTRHGDRADGALLPFGRAWKTRQPSSPRPDQVVASFGADPRRELAISWRTDPSITASAVRFVPAGRPRNSSAVRVFEGTAHPVSSDGLLNDPTILRHQVTASGLEPATRYAYAVGDGSAPGWSDWYETSTAPATPIAYSFLYLGDAQCELERWGELAHVARKARPDAGFMLLVGDLVDRGNERSNWDHFFLRAAGVFDAIPLMPAVGNHEYLDKGPEIYRRTFDLPKNGPAGTDANLVYSFEYADAFVAVLDSTQALFDRVAAERQAAWLDDALARTRATWKFVAFHHPIYASHPSRANPQLGEVWVPIFDRHGVDMVLTGHDHAYLRTVPMRAGHPAPADADGTVYVVAVSGEKFYGQTPHDYTAKGLTHVATYQTIDVEVASRRLQYRSFDREGKEVDALTIDKSRRLPLAPSQVATTMVPAE